LKTNQERATLGELEGKEQAMKNLGMLILLCLVLGTVGVYSHVYKELQYTKDMVVSAEAARDAAAKTSTSFKEQLKSKQDAKVFIEAALKHANGQLLADKRTADATLAKVKDQLSSTQTDRRAALRLLTSAKTARRRAERRLRRCNAD
jgi:uncharacterized protein HemX